MTERRRFETSGRASAKKAATDLSGMKIYLIFQKYFLTASNNKFMLEKIFLQ